MGISDDIRLTNKSPNKKKLQNPLGPDDIKIKYSRKEDESDDNNKIQQHSQMEDDFFDDYKAKHDSSEPKDRQDGANEDLPKTKYKEEDYHQPKKQGNPMAKWVVLLVLILICLLIWQNWSKISKITGWGSEQEQSKEVLPKYSSTTEGTDYTAGSATANTPADSSAASTPATATPAIDKSKITIQVLNGNGISGSANKIKADLVSAGFTVDSVKNALKFSYQSSIIYYKTDKSSEADLVKSTLTGLQSELTNSDSIVGNYDIVIVVGKT